MTVFIAHENLQKDGDGALVCLADRFNWFAFFLPPVWAISKGLWGILALMVVALIGLVFISEFIDFPLFTTAVLGAWWLGFEANALQGAALERRGYRENGVFFAQNLMQAESKYFGRQRRKSRLMERQAKRAQTSDRGAS